MMYEPRMWVGDEAKRECHVHLLLTCIDFVCDLLFKKHGYGSTVVPVPVLKNVHVEFLLSTRFYI